MRLPLFLWSCLVGVCVASLSVASFSRAADTPAAPLPASTREALQDLMGEYVGEVSGGLSADRPISLQIRATPAATLEGFLLIGGLPGAGWNGFARVPVTGGVVDGIATVRNTTYEIRIDRGGFGSVRYTYGRTEIGRVRKVLRTSPTLGLCPPCEAIRLFDGRDTLNFKNGRISPEGNLMVGAETLGAWQDFHLHVEFRTPFMPEALGQARGNSGIYLQNRYEVQILDSFALPGMDNDCGALYRQRKADVNMSLPPLSWQTYDIEFRAARFDASGRRCEPARICVMHNGVVIHNHVELSTKTGGGAAEGPIALPIKFQDHGNAVEFRNVWLIDRCAPVCCVPCCDPCCTTCCQTCCVRPRCCAVPVCQSCLAATAPADGLSVALGLKNAGTTRTATRTALVGLTTDEDEFANQRLLQLADAARD